MSRSVRLETRSRARDELRRAMTSIDKVKKWEKKWVSVGSNACSLRVYKWVPRDASKDPKKPTPTKEAPKAPTEPTAAPPAPVVPPLPEENSASSDSVEKTDDKSIKFPANQFLPSVNETNEDSRDSFTASSAEFMKYCPDPDSQDSLTCSDYTATMSDQLEDSTKPNSKCSTPPLTDKNMGDPKITVADAFKNKQEPTALTLPEQPAAESEEGEQLTELKEQPKPQPIPTPTPTPAAVVVSNAVVSSDVVVSSEVTPAAVVAEDVVMHSTGESVEAVDSEGPPAKKIKEDTSEP